MLAGPRVFVVVFFCLFVFCPDQRTKVHLDIGFFVGRPSGLFRSMSKWTTSAITFCFRNFLFLFFLCFLFLCFFFCLLLDVQCTTTVETTWRTKSLTNSWMLACFIAFLVEMPWSATKTSSRSGVCARIVKACLVRTLLYHQPMRWGGHQKQQSFADQNKLKSTGLVLIAEKSLCRKWSSLSSLGGGSGLRSGLISSS